MRTLGSGSRGHSGYPTFERVVRGAEVPDEIHRLPTDAPAVREVVQGQILNELVPIVSAGRAE